MLVKTFFMSVIRSQDVPRGSRPLPHLRAFPAAVVRGGEFAALDVIANVAHALVAELAVAQPRHRVVFVKPLQRLSGRFGVPLDQRSAQALWQPRARARTCRSRARL